MLRSPLGKMLVTVVNGMATVVAVVVDGAVVVVVVVVTRLTVTTVKTCELDWL
jgi:hypothetical protein